MASSLFILDVQEKETSEAKAPSFPQIKPGTTGFPEHKKRTKTSTFRQKRQAAQPDDQKPNVFLSSDNQPPRAPSHSPATPSSNQTTQKPDESGNIDRENRQKLASMSPRQIEQARQDLFSDLDPSVLQMLLKRANLDEGANTLPFDEPPAAASGSGRADASPENRIEDTPIQTTSSALPNKSPAEQNTSKPPSMRPRPHVEDADERDTLPKNIAADDSAPAAPPQEHIVDPSSSELEGAHWPRAPQPADLDPADPDFLQNLHEKYFPSLPADPSKLAWMAPVPTPNSPADRDSPYYPGQDSLPVSALRFDFRGALLPPRISRAVLVSKGLHHHGEAPEAAGYTVRELARLARSAVPGQRCVAYQTLGRIFYRLGHGDFGGVGRDDVSMGIWREFEEGRILRSLHDEIGAEGSRGRGHLSARTYATEAIWLFEKGGWKDKLKKA
ncbi:RPAP1-like protein [Xylaria palmicola]|nr:RPAP1-like protein [Xylaria palmicola]